MPTPSETHRIPDRGPCIHCGAITGKPLNWAPDQLGPDYQCHNAEDCRQRRAAILRIREVCGAENAVKQYVHVGGHQDKPQPRWFCADVGACTRRQNDHAAWADQRYAITEAGRVALADDATKEAA